MSNGRRYAAGQTAAAVPAAASDYVGSPSAASPLSERAEHDVAASSVATDAAAGAYTLCTDAATTASASSSVAGWSRSHRATRSAASWGVRKDPRLRLVEGPAAACGVWKDPPSRRTDAVYVSRQGSCFTYQNSKAVSARTRDRPSAAAAVTAAAAFFG